jgi:hypothetical protein
MQLKRLAIAGAALALTLTVTTSAFARAGDRPFAETYPVASALCVKAHAGTLGSKLVSRQAAAVITACDTLENAYGPLVSTVDAAEATLPERRLDAEGARHGRLPEAGHRPGGLRGRACDCEVHDRRRQNDRADRRHGLPHAPSRPTARRSGTPSARCAERRGSRRRRASGGVGARERAHICAATVPSR